MQAGEGIWRDKGEEARLGRRTRELGDGVTMCQPIRASCGVSETPWRGLGEPGLGGQSLGPPPWEAAHLAKVTLNSGVNRELADAAEG